MKFGKSIGSQQEGHADLHYVDYKLLKKKIKDVVQQLLASELSEALTANRSFEEELSQEIQQVNLCFASRQKALLARTGNLSEQLLLPQEAAGGSASRADALKQLVDMLQQVDQLRKYAVWNAVAVVKILKKRRKQTSFGIEDAAAERAGWLARQNFFSGSDFAELHASLESLGHMLVLSEIVPEGGAGRVRSQCNQEPQRCPICLDTISDMVELSCDHRFCWKCFVLGPIAFQPGEYRITQCPICRRETDQGQGDDVGAPVKDSEGSVMHGTQQEGLLTRFLHTYFPGKVTDDKAGLNGLDIEDEDVGELAKVLLADCHLPREAASSDFFDTLPRQEERPLKAAQKVQWLQLASTNDPFALDDNMYCSLCSEPLMMEAVVTTPCKHHFHRVCINRVDTPQCPLCDMALPFSWFLPADHPCVEHGFRTVTPRKYQPCFAGGPSKGCCGYPLQRPPPALLYGPVGTMRSYLHRLIPTGTGVHTEDDAEDHVLQAKHEEPHDEEESSSDSNSEEEHEEMKGGRLKPPPVYLYSAVGRMKLLGRRGASGEEGGPARILRPKSEVSAEGEASHPRVQLFSALFGNEKPG